MSTECATNPPKPVASKRAISRSRRFLGIAIALLVVPAFAATICWLSQREAVIAIEVEHDVGGQYEVELFRDSTLMAKSEQHATFIFSRARRYEVRVKPGTYCIEIHRCLYRPYMWDSDQDGDSLIRSASLSGIGRQCLFVQRCFRLVPGDSKVVNLSREYPY
jgi:hypothetical protein